MRRRESTAREARAGWGNLLWFEGALLAALVGFTVARAWVVWHMFNPDRVDPAGRAAAAQTYDLVFTVLAVFAGGIVVAPERTGRVLLSVTGFAHVSYVDSLFMMASAVCDGSLQSQLR